MEKEKYTKLKKFLLDEGFKCVDIAIDGDEIFEKNGFKFSVRPTD